MKIIYCINCILGTGGMERVLVDRANYLVEKFNYEVYIVTSDEKNDKEPFFKLNSKIKIIPLEINSFEGLHNNFFLKKYQLKKKTDLFLSKLTKVVNEIKPDVLVSMGDHSRGIVWQINYSCKKYVENHFSKRYIIEGREITEKETLKKKIKNFYREYNAKKLIERYDNFLVLTEEDKKNWDGKEEKCDKIKVINNPLTFFPNKVSLLDQKKVISFDCPCGPKDIIKNGKNGFLCKFNDIEAMAEKIIYLIKNEEERKRMGNISREMSSNYFEDKIMNQWKELYES